MLRCGLLGRKLGHSYSPVIHEQLGGYTYELFEKEEEELEAFILGREYDGLNVTIPYKKTVMKYMDEVSEQARAIGSINTIVKRPDNTLYGDNTDLYGFSEMVRKSGADVSGKKAVVLGSGGASVSVCATLKRLGAQVVVISRSGEFNYNNLELNSDAAIVVNTTPVGMYPAVDEAPVDLKAFPSCECVLDIVYNPTKTKLIKQADELGIINENGLYMLVAQAVRSSELFTGRKYTDDIQGRVYDYLYEWRLR